MDLTTIPALQASAQSDVQLLLATALFAAERHRDQRRKDPRGTPYVNHPLEVAARISGVGSSIGPSPPVWILQGALLQSVTPRRDSEPRASGTQECFANRRPSPTNSDTVEDTNTTLQELEQAFGARVAKIGKRARPFELGYKARSG